MCALARTWVGGMGTPASEDNRGLRRALKHRKEQIEASRRSEADKETERVRLGTSTKLVPTAAQVSRYFKHVAEDPDPSRRHAVLVAFCMLVAAVITLLLVAWVKFEGCRWSVLALLVVWLYLGRSE